MALAAILYFQVMWIWHSGMLKVWCLSFNCTKFGSNICHSRWDRRSFNYVTRINFRFRLLVAWPCRVIPPTLVHISLFNPELLTFSRNSRWRPLPSWIFKLCELCTMRHISSEVLELGTKFSSNMLVSEIDALLIPTFIWWRHVN